MSSADNPATTPDDIHDPYNLQESELVCCGHHETNSERAIVYALVGGSMVFTTLLARWTGTDKSIAELPAVIGAILLWVPLMLGARKEIQRGRPSSSSLATIAIAAAFAIQQYVTAGVLAFILFMMDAVVRRTAWGAHKAIEGLVKLTPSTARILLDDGSEQEVPIREIHVGTVIRVRPGENLPADGNVITGRSTINQASLTGESAPIEVEVGDSVYAGTSNLTGGIDVEVTRVGADSTIGKVVTLINEAERSKTPRQQIIEMVSRHYVWIVLMVTVAVWILSDKSGAVTGERSATEKAISVLVVTCPGALLLASPTAMVAAFASAARLGIMIKSAQTLEAAGGLDTVVLDKTGTITTGKFAVSRLAPAEGVEGGHLLSRAATAEQHSNHPLAKAIVETAQAARVKTDDVTEAQEQHGLGLRVQVNGGSIHVGRAAWLLEVNPGIRAQVEAAERRIEGMTGVHVLDNDKYLGAVGLEDQIRPSAVEVVTQLREVGVRHVCMFTGDRTNVADRVARAVGIDLVESECHPQEKHDKLVAMTQRGQRVMMVGDGINDGPSLAAADVGVAMGLGGTDIAANSAGIALMNDDLTRLPFLIRLARKTRAIVGQNIAAAILIAIVGLALAASGTLGIWSAAIYHVLGDVFVAANSFRLVRFGEEYEEVEAAQAGRQATTNVPAAPALGAAPEPASTSS